MKKIISLLLFLHCLSYLGNSNALTLPLPSDLAPGKVQQTFMDSRGNLWATGPNRLFFFNGQSFQTVQEWAGESPSTVRILFEDASGNLWLQRTDAISRVVELVNIMDRILKHPSIKAEGYLLNLVTAAKGPSNSLYLGDDRGLVWKQNAKGEVQALYQSKTGRFEFAGTVFDKGPVWIQLLADQGNQGSFVAVSKNGSSYSFSVNEKILATFPSEKGGLWVLSSNRYTHLFPGQLSESKTSAMYRSLMGSGGSLIAQAGRLDRVWCFHRQQLIRWNLRTERVEQVVQEELSPSVEGTSLMSEGHHQLWLGTSAGVIQVEVPSTQFNRIQFGEEASSIAPPCFEMAASGDGSILINTPGQLFRYFPKSQRISSVWRHQGIGAAFAQEKDGSLVFAASDLIRVGQGMQKREKLASLPNLGVVRSIHSSQHRIWMSTTEGLYYFDRSSRKVNSFRPYNQHVLLREARINQILESASTGILTLVTSQGICQIHPQDGVVAHFKPGGGCKNYLSIEECRTLCPDGNGGYWVATGKGLLHWSWLEGVPQLYTVKEGLSSNNIQAVKLDQEGFIWASSDKGLIQLHPLTGRIKTYTVVDGLNQTVFCKASQLTTENGLLFFGGEQGVTWLQPNEFNSLYAQNSIPPTPQKEVLFAQVGASTTPRKTPSDQLQPGHLEQMISLPSLSAPITTEEEQSANSYKQQEGDDRTAPAPREFGTRGLTPGDFHVDAIATSPSLFTLRSLGAIDEKVDPPFYRKGWFYGLGTLLLLVAALLFIQMRTRWLRLRQHELELEVNRRTAGLMEEMRQAEARLYRLQYLEREQTQLMTNLMHELRTPLSLVLGPLERIQQAPGQRNPGIDLLQVASSNAQRMLDMVNDALTFQSILDGKMSSQFVPVQLESYLRNLLKEYAVLVEVKKLHLDTLFELSEGLVVQTDPRCLQGILNNLMSNALKFTKEGGIGVLVSETPECIHLRVSDTGRGIHPEDLPNIFKRYYQTQRQNVPKEGGAGIGLALCEELAGLLGGTIRAESTYGSGTTFIVTFPKELADPAVAEEVNKSAQLAGMSAISRVLPLSPDKERLLGSTLLLVEDNLDFQGYLKAMFQPVCQLEVVNNGLEALQWLEEHGRPDVLLVDLLMPEMDGYQLIQELKHHEEYNTIPILVVSARVQSDERLDLLRMGVDDYLNKPFTESELMATISNALMRAQQRLPEGGEPVMVRLEELKWLQKLEQLVFDHLGMPGFSVDWCATQMLTARSQFYKDVKRLTGMTPNQYIQEARLEKGRRLLEEGNVRSLKKLAVDLGVQDERYYSKLFKERFGRTIRSYK